jgi:hypothetical protein
MPNVICPICKSKAQPLDKVGDADGFDCPHHKRFKVAGSVFATQHKYASPEEWETALTKAKQRTEQGEWPLIETHDF